MEDNQEIPNPIKKSLIKTKVKLVQSRDHKMIKLNLMRDPVHLNNKIQIKTNPHNQNKHLLSKRHKIIIKLKAKIITHQVLVSLQQNLAKVFQEEVEGLHKNKSSQHKLDL